MTTWVLKEPTRLKPHDLLCVQLDDEWLLFIQEEGTFDIAHIECGKPTDSMWWKFE